MPCSSASAFASSQSVIPLTVSTFDGIGQIEITNTKNVFVDLAKSIPFVCSSVNSYITSLVSKTFEPNFKPTYFQIPYIYSVCDNLFNGIYKESSSVEDNIISTKYEIPYKRQNKEEIVIITTYLNTLTNILFYEVPSELTYNSLKQASVAVTTLSDGSFSGKIAIPTTFTSLLLPKYPNRFLPFKINPYSDNLILADVFVSKKPGSGYPICQGTQIESGQPCSDFAGDPDCSSHYGKSNEGDWDIQCYQTGSECVTGYQCDEP